MKEAFYNQKSYHPSIAMRHTDKYRNTSVYLDNGVTEILGFTIPVVEVWTHCSPSQ